jgi:hypothetical protein
MPAAELASPAPALLSEGRAAFAASVSAIELVLAAESAAAVTVFAVFWTVPAAPVAVPVTAWVACFAVSATVGGEGTFAAAGALGAGWLGTLTGASGTFTSGTDTGGSGFGAGAAGVDTGGGATVSKGFVTGAAASSTAPVISPRGSAAAAAANSKESKAVSDQVPKAEIEVSGRFSLRRLPMTAPLSLIG